MSANQSKRAGEEVPRWQTPRTRVIGVLSLLLIGFMGTRGALSTAPIFVVAYAVFALLAITLTVWRPTDIRVVSVRGMALGIYLTVVGFGVLGVGHNYVTGAAGAFWLLLAAIPLVAGSACEHAQNTPRLRG